MRSLYTTIAVALFTPALALADATVNNAAELSAALASASAGDTITLTAAGSPYVGNFDAGQTSFVSLIGETGDPNDVVIDGGGSGAAYTAGGGFTIAVPGKPMRIEGITFRNGDVGLLATITAYNDVVTYRNCVFEDNGTGMSTRNLDALLIEDCVFRRNNGLQALFAEARDPSAVRRCVFEDNGTSFTPVRLIARDGCVIEDCSFERNVTTSNVGVVQVDGPLTIRGSGFIANQSGDGGTLLVDSAELIERCYFEGNTSARGGAIFVIKGVTDNTSGTIRSNVFVNNTATSVGGAIALDCRDCPSRPALLVDLNTFIDNDAPVGPAIDAGVGDNDRLSVWNNVFWSQTPPSSDWVGGDAVIEFNAAASGIPAPQNVLAEPVMVDPLAGDYRLAPGSPAIDAGSVVAGTFARANRTAAQLAPELVFDFDGQPRVVDDPATPNTGYASTTGPIDIGALEFQPGPECIADVTTTNTNPSDPGYGEPDGTVDGNDLSYYVEQWLAGCP